MFPLEYAIELENVATGKYDTVALVQLEGTAKIMAQAYSDATGWPLRVKKIK
jgi:hypothetical protein